MNDTKALTRKASSAISVFNDISTVEQLDRFIDYVANSDTYNLKFSTAVTEDNKVVRKVDRNAIATCLILGNELGFKPMESIMLGRRLDDKAVIRVYRGRDLGLSSMASMQNIHVWEKDGKETVYTGIHVIYKCLNDAGVKIDVIDDGTKPFPYYVLDRTKEEIELNERIHIVVNDGISAKELEQALIVDKKVPVLKRYTRRGLVKLTREETNTEIALPYTLLQAVDAGLYRGVNSFGEEVKGKNNWNSHPAAHLIKMSVMNGARIIIGDKLNGAVYIPEELPIDERTIEDTDARVVG